MKTMKIFFIVLNINMLCALVHGGAVWNQDEVPDNYVRKAIHYNIGAYYESGAFAAPLKIVDYNENLIPSFPWEKIKQELNISSVEKIIPLTGIPTFYFYVNNPEGKPECFELVYRICNNMYDAEDFLIHRICYPPIPFFSHFESNIGDNYWTFPQHPYQDQKNDYVMIMNRKNIYVALSPDPQKTDNTLSGDEEFYHHILRTIDAALCEVEDVEECDSFPQPRIESVNVLGQELIDSQEMPYYNITLQINASNPLDGELRYWNGNAPSTETKNNTLLVISRTNQNGVKVFVTNAECYVSSHVYF